MVIILQLYPRLFRMFHQVPKIHFNKLNIFSYKKHLKDYHQIFVQLFKDLLKIDHSI